MYSGLKLLLGIVMFTLLLMVFSCSMFFLAAKEANAVMGAPDQTPAEKHLSECTTDSDCRIAYDEVYGAGAWEMMENLMRNCGASTPGGNCPLDENGNSINHEDIYIEGE